MKKCPMTFVIQKHGGGGGKGGEVNQGTAADVSPMHLCNAQIRPI